MAKEDREVREYLTMKMKILGLSINVDGVGNIRAKYIDNNEDKTFYNDRFSYWILFLMEESLTVLQE